jgi:hypothetical protein
MWSAADGPNEDHIETSDRPNRTSSRNDIIGRSWIVCCKLKYVIRSVGVNVVVVVDQMPNRTVPIGLPQIGSSCLYGVLGKIGGKTRFLLRAPCRTSLLECSVLLTKVPTNTYESTKHTITITFNSRAKTYAYETGKESRV